MLLSVLDQLDFRHSQPQQPNIPSQAASPSQSRGSDAVVKRRNGPALCGLSKFGLEQGPSRSGIRGLSLRRHCAGAQIQSRPGIARDWVYKFLTLRKYELQIFLRGYEARSFKIHFCLRVNQTSTQCRGEGIPVNGIAECSIFCDERAFGSEVHEKCD